MTNVHDNPVKKEVDLGVTVPVSASRTRSGPGAIGEHRAMRSLQDYVDLN